VCQHTSQKGCPILGRTDADTSPCRLQPKVEDACLVFPATPNTISDSPLLDNHTGGWATPSVCLTNIAEMVCGYVCLPAAAACTTGWSATRIGYLRLSPLRSAEYDSIRKSLLCGSNIACGIPYTADSSNPYGLVHDHILVRRDAGTWDDTLAEDQNDAANRSTFLGTVECPPNGWQYHQSVTTSFRGSKPQDSPAGPPIPGSWRCGRLLPLPRRVRDGVMKATNRHRTNVVKLVRDSVVTRCKQGWRLARWVGNWAAVVKHILPYIVVSAW